MFIGFLTSVSSLMCVWVFLKDLFIYYLFYLFLAVLGLSCGMRDLLLQCVGFSLVVVYGFSLL